MSLRGCQEDSAHLVWRLSSLSCTWCFPLWGLGVCSVRLLFVIVHKTRHRKSVRGCFQRVFFSSGGLRKRNKREVSKKLHLICYRCRETWLSLAPLWCFFPPVWLLIICPTKLFRKLRVFFFFFERVFKVFRGFPPHPPSLLITEKLTVIVLSSYLTLAVETVCGDQEDVRKRNIKDLRDTVIECHMSVPLAGMFLMLHCTSSHVCRHVSVLAIGTG